MQSTYLLRMELGRGLARVDQAGLICGDHGLHAIAKPELLEDARHVR